MNLSVILVIAADIISWDAPTTREGIDGQPGDPLPADEICNYRIIIDDTDDYLLPPTPTSWDAAPVSNGVHTYKMTTIDCDGRESLFSQIESFNKRGKPNPPTNLRHNWVK